MARMSATDRKRKADAMADLMNGDQPAVVAARYGFPGGTVRMWKNRLVTPDVTAGVTVVAASPGMRQPAIEAQQMELGDLIMANLRAKLIATQRIAEYATTQEWLYEQTAADVATLFEALDRSALGILDRLARGSNATPDDDSAGDTA